MARYTIQELSSLTGISVRSLRNYLHAFSEHLHPERATCNALVFSDEDAQAFLKIRTMLREGHTRDEVRKLMESGGPAAGMVIRRTDQPAPPATPAPDGSGVPALPTDGALAALLTRLDRQTELLEGIARENLALRERLEVLEVRLRLRDPGLPQLPAATPRTVPVRRGAIRIPVPYFLLRIKDGAVALGVALWDALRPGSGERSALRA